MSDLLVPDPIATQPQGISHPVNLCDSTGKKLGYFAPVLDLSEYEIEPELSEEELREIEASTEWYSTDEVLRHLEKLE